MCAVLLTNYRIPLSTTGTKQENLIMRGEVIMKMAWVYEYCPYQLTFDECISGSKTQCNVNKSCHQIYFIPTAGKVLSQQVWKVLWHTALIEFLGNFPLLTYVSLFQCSENCVAQQEEVAKYHLPLLNSVMGWFGREHFSLLQTRLWPCK